jgi:hypothetical protein
LASRRSARRPQREGSLVGVESFFDFLQADEMITVNNINKLNLLSIIAGRFLG